MYVRANIVNKDILIREKMWSAYKLVHLHMTGILLICSSRQFLDIFDSMCVMGAFLECGPIL